MPFVAVLVFLQRYPVIASRRHVHQAGVVHVQLVGELAGLSIERKPRHVDGTVRLRQLEQRPPSTRSVAEHFQHV